MPVRNCADKGPAILLMLLVLLGSACSGFFVDPALTSLAVTPPTPSLMEGNTLQMTANASYEDGTTRVLTSSVIWGTSDVTVAAVSTTGLVQGIAPGTVSISVSSGAISGSTTVTVTLSGLVSIQVTPTNASISSGHTQAFQAMGVLQNGQREEITRSVTWNSSRPLVATIDASGLATAKTVDVTAMTQITAVSGTVVSNAATLTVSP